MKRSSQPRATANLSESVHRQLNMYALAASAAGVGVLALAQPAEAKVVYTKTHKVIHAYRFVNLDLNNDGVTDFKLAIVRLFGSYGAGALTVYQFNSGNSVRLSGTGAAAYPAGIRIGPTGFHERPPKTSQGRLMEYGCDPMYRCVPSFGNWLRVENRYLGLSFVLNGKTHYGWARVSATIVPPDNHPNARLTGYAYETIPNKPIITGKTKGPDVITVQPASLGHLAAGASAVPAWRVKRTAATTH